MKNLSLCLFLMGPTSYVLAQSEKKEDPKPVNLSQFISKNTVYFSGSLRFRQEEQQKTDLSADRSYGLLRARMEFLIRPSEENWSVFIQPQFSKIYGHQDYVGSGTSSNTLTNTSGNTADTPASFHQGYLNYRPVDNFSIIVGREELSYGNELIIGKLNWGNVGRSFDTVHARYDNGKVWSDLFGAKIAETNSNVKANSSYKGDRDLFGSYSSITNLGFIDTVDLYALYLNDHEMKPKYSVMTLGTRLVSKIKKFDYRLEMNKQLDNINSSTIDGEIGFTFDDAKKFRLGAGAFIAESDYEHYYPGWHSWLGYADMLGRKNIKGTTAVATYQAMDNLNLQLNYLTFWRADTNLPAYKTDTRQAWANNSKASDIASEIDLTLGYKVPKGPQLRGGVSKVFLGSYFTQQYTNFNPWFYYLELEVRF